MRIIRHIIIHTLQIQPTTTRLTGTATIMTTFIQTKLNT